MDRWIIPIVAGILIVAVAVLLALAFTPLLGKGS